jgi:hypothetical protein
VRFLRVTMELNAVRRRSTIGHDFSVAKTYPSRTLDHLQYDSTRLGPGCYSPGHQLTRPRPPCTDLTTRSRRFLVPGRGKSSGAGPGEYDRPREHFAGGQHVPPAHSAFGRVWPPEPPPLPSQPKKGTAAAAAAAAAAATTTGAGDKGAGARQLMVDPPIEPRPTPPFCFTSRRQVGDGAPPPPYPHIGYYEPTEPSAAATAAVARCSHTIATSSLPRGVYNPLQGARLEYLYRDETMLGPGTHTPGWGPWDPAVDVGADTGPAKLRGKPSACFAPSVAVSARGVVGKHGGRSGRASSSGSSGRRSAARWGGWDASAGGPWQWDSDDERRSARGGGTPGPGAYDDMRGQIDGLFRTQRLAEWRRLGAEGRRQIQQRREREGGTLTEVTKCDRVPKCSPFMEGAQSSCEMPNRHRPVSPPRPPPPETPVPPEEQDWATREAHVMALFKDGKLKAAQRCARPHHRWPVPAHTPMAP